MKDALTLGEKELLLLKTISGQAVEPLEFGDLYYNINTLERYGFIEDEKVRITNLTGNLLTIKQKFALTEKGKAAIANHAVKPEPIKGICPACTCYLEAVQRHTGKWQAICQTCGMRSPFMDSFEDLEAWARKEAEKDEKLANMRKIWGQS